MVDRFSIEGHKEALIDLYLLAGTQKILGTKQSTFSYEAAVMGDVPFIEISGKGLRQEYNLVYDKRVIIDFRDNGIRDFSKEMIYDKRSKESFKVVDVEGKALLEFAYDELKKMDRPCVMDVGACTGAFALLTKFVDGCRVYAFEPDESLADLLRFNLRLNNVEDRVEVLDFGLSRGKKDGHSHATEGSRHARGEALGKEPQGMVNGIDTLDGFICMRNIRKLDLIRINVRGAEHWILKDCKKSIQSLRPHILLEHGHAGKGKAGGGKNPLVNFIKSLGYGCQYIGPDNIYCRPVE